MPALNFQKWSAPLVESGEKRQTIRAYRKDGRDPKVGDTLYLYTGMRTKQCRKLGEVVCVSIAHVKIHEWGVMRDGKILGVRQIQRFAADDGFHGGPGVGTNWHLMHSWFDKTHSLPFEGLLIKWGDIDAARDEIEMEE